MIAAQCFGQLMAPFTVEGSCNRSVFEIWLETCLIPVLKPGQVVVMDNATFHKGGRRRATDSGSWLIVAVLTCLFTGLTSVGFLQKQGKKFTQIQNGQLKYQ